jgi:hypothetical protein
VFFMLAGGGIAVALARGDNPVAELVAGQDSGVEACEAIRDAEQQSTEDSSEPFTFEQYQQLREQFADSKHEAIRTNGIELIDLAWQMDQLGEDAGLEALPLIGSFMEAYAGLTGGCAEQGVQIPPLEFDTPAPE